MTYAEFLSELDEAALSVRDFAALMHMHPNSISNYARLGEVPAHLAVIVALLGELRRNNVDPRPVFDRLQLAGKRPRGTGKAGQFGGDPQTRLAL